MSISTRIWMGCKSIAGFLPSIKFIGTHLYTWMEEDAMKVMCLAKNTTQGLEPGLLYPVTSALTIRKPLCKTT